MGITSILTSLATSYSTRSIDSSWDIDDVAVASDAVAGVGIWMIISLVIAVIGGILAYFLFVKSKTANPSNKFLAWLKSFLKFDKMFIEDIIKIIYIVSAIFITLFSFAMIGVNFLAFLMTLIIGNLALRVTFEATMMTIMIWRNTADIKKSVCDKEEKKK